MNHSAVEVMRNRLRVLGRTGCMRGASLFICSVQGNDVFVLRRKPRGRHVRIRDRDVILLLTIIFVLYVTRKQRTRAKKRAHPSVTLVTFDVPYLP